MARSAYETVQSSAHWQIMLIIMLLIMGDEFEELDNLKRLSPEERIKKLKDLEEKHKKEIEEARKLITESERELEAEEDMRRDIPLPQLKSIDIDTLFSTEEKDLFKMKRYLSDKKAEPSEGVEGKTRKSEESFDMLEEMVREEQAKLSEDQVKQYGAQLKKIEDEISQLYQSSKESPQEFGYAEMKRVYELENQMKEVRQRYKSMSEQTAESIETSEQIINKLKMYKG